jgi:hypothetical protein
MAIVIKRAIRTVFNSLGYEIIKRELPVDPNTLILLSTQRSGSTWFTNAIRCHPLVEIWPDCKAWQMLGLFGRRYPGDLSGGLGGKLVIESYPGHWDRIPVFEVSSQLQCSWDNINEEPYALEKCHPHFFSNDSERFVSNLLRLEGSKPTKPVKSIYQVRDPRTTICSYLNYNKRNKEWGAGSSKSWSALANHMVLAHKSIYDISRARPGLVVDYKEISGDLESLLRKVYLYLWPDANEDETELAEQVSLAAVGATQRDKLATGSPFFGKVVGDVEGNAGQYDQFFEQYAVEMEVCYKYYGMLLEER